MAVGVALGGAVISLALAIIIIGLALTNWDFTLPSGVVVRQAAFLPCVYPL